MMKHIKINGFFYSILSNYKTYVDTNIFLDEETARTWKKVLVRRLAVASKKFVVIRSVLLELKKKANFSDYALAKRAKKALADISTMIKQNLCEIEDDGVHVGFADAGFLELFGRKRFHENLLLVTRDQNLARDILKLNGFSSAKSYREILVWRMGDDGLLDSQYHWFPQRPFPHPQKETAKLCDVITCCDCNKSFELKSSEKNFYLKKGLCIPKRCEACREKKKKAVTPMGAIQKIFGAKPPKEQPSSSNVSSGSSSGGGVAIPGFWGTGLGDIVGALLL